jgi:arylsulfatase A-like enzyme
MTAAMTRRSLVVRFGALACLFGLAACREAPTATAAASASSSAEPPLVPPGLRKVVSIVDDLGWCDIDHRGLLLDLGTDAVLGRFGHALATPKGVVASEHEGATWARVYDGKLSLTFLQTTAERVFVALRARGRDARKADVFLDDAPLGTVALGTDTKILSTATTRLPIDPGLHELTIRFRGARGSEEEPFAEIDWVRVAVPDELTRGYGAPTLYDVRALAAQLGGIARRALALRAPTTVGCTLRVPTRATFRTSVGMMGGGKATAVVSIREDGAKPVELRRVDVEGGANAAWTDLEVPLSDYAGRVVRLELDAAETVGTGRLLFGDPTVFVDERPPTDVVRAKAAVLVVLDGVERAELPPFRAEAPHVPNLKHLVSTATVFEQHRGSTTLANAALATLLTGLPPRSHGLFDAGARLPKGLRTLGDVAREGSVRAAMFTGVPTTFAAHGFERHWESFFAFPPNEGKPGSAPIDAATAWFSEVGTKEKEARPMLAVVHARGGHPPWDVTPAEASKLPPQKYSGAMRPRDAAQAIASLQGKFTRLTPGDEERLRAMHFAALFGEDAAIGRLIHKLEEIGLWDQTLFVVTADVSSAMRSLFADGAPLTEEALALPLYVHFPGSSPTPIRVTRDTESADITRTLLSALGLSTPPDVGGRDLGAIAMGFDDEPYRIRVAHAEDGYSARWGDYVLVGKLDDKRPMLCDLTRDPTCAYDHTVRRPIVAHALFRRFAALEASRPKSPEREPLSLDSEAAGMLKVWGVY